MTPFTFDDYLECVERDYKDNPDMTWGQIYWFVLQGERPDLAVKIRGGPLDPFLIQSPSDNLTAFKEWAREHW